MGGVTRAGSPGQTPSRNISQPESPAHPLESRTALQAAAAEIMLNALRMFGIRLGYGTRATPSSPTTAVQTNRLQSLSDTRQWLTKLQLINYPGNTIRQLIDGVESFPQRAQNIRNADWIICQSYNFEDDETGRDLVTQLKDRLDAGANVILLFDVKGHYRNDIVTLTRISYGKDPVPPFLKDLHEYATAAKGKFFVVPLELPTPSILPSSRFDQLQMHWKVLTWANYLPGGAVLQPLAMLTQWLLGQYLYRDHEKFLLTYQKGEPVTCITGGINVENEWRDCCADETRPPPAPDSKKTYRLHDIDYELRGPIVIPVLYRIRYNIQRNGNIAALQAFDQFLTQLGISADQWCVDRGLPKNNPAFPLVTGGSELTFTANFPEIGPTGQLIKKQLITEIQRVAKDPSGDRTIYIGTPFFFPTDDIKQLMIASSQQGVKWKILTNSPFGKPINMKLTSLAARDLFAELFDQMADSSLEVYEWGGSYPINSPKKEPVFSAIGFVGTNLEKSNLDLANNGTTKQGADAVHYKLYWFGGSKPTAMFGSSNPDYLSFTFNSEALIASQDRRQTSEIRAILETDVASPFVRKLTKDALTDRSDEEKTLSRWIRACIRDFL